MWLLLLAADPPASPDPASWVTYLFTIAPLSGFALLMWWFEHQRANDAERKLEEAHARERIAASEALPVLTRAVDALTLLSHRDPA